ncbi:hypothetical protein SAMN05216553_120148 [Lentzea fradiae]|uniref:Uncharacterized protein n=1 Tax=Lentzea fradiae TaxID=200378 RepID=A0A1G8C1U1_9PSEU|nr:hypothetical protein [Lentzea fradiae]SDH38870.1 hypothetical protein SAMN05216553_120148 [Lentzea fradiae]
MSFRDAALILAHRELFEDLDAALALVGAVLEEPGADVPLVPLTVVEPAGTDDRIDEDDWPVTGNDGWGDAELEATDAGEGRTDPEQEQSDGGGSGGGKGQGGRRKAPAAKPAGLGVIAQVLVGEPDDLDSGGRAPRAYTSVPLPKHRSWQVDRDLSGFRTRTLALTLQSMIRVPLRGHEPDIPAVVQRLALAEPLADVPMRPRLGQPARVRVLCDLALTIGPYAEDTELLIRVLRRLCGAERVDLRWFELSPAHGCGSGPVWTWQRYEMPGPAEATVLVAQGVADRRSDPAAIHEFASALADHGAAVCAVLLGPGPRVPRFRRYPQLLVDD